MLVSGLFSLESTSTCQTSVDRRAVVAAAAMAVGILSCCKERKRDHKSGDHCGGGGGGGGAAAIKNLAPCDVPIWPEKGIPRKKLQEKSPILDYPSRSFRLSIDDWLKRSTEYTHDRLSLSSIPYLDLYHQRFLSIDNSVYERALKTIERLELVCYW